MTDRLLTEDLVTRLRARVDDPALGIVSAWHLLEEAANEIARLRPIEDAARDLVTTGMSLRFTSGPALSVIEKPDKSDPHYRLCTLLEHQPPRANRG